MILNKWPNPTHPPLRKKTLLRDDSPQSCFLALTYPEIRPQKNLPFFVLFLNDQNAKDTEKEGARSRGSGKRMAEGVEGASMKLTAVKNSVGCFRK